MDAILPPADFGRRGLDRAALKRSFLEWLVYSVGKDPDTATSRDWFSAVALSVRDRIVDNWMQTTRRYYDTDQKRVYYLSLEFLIGRQLNNCMSNLGIVEVCREALREVGVDLPPVIFAEPEAALGNGGLGRLAACFLDSMTTLGIAGFGYGIRYQYGLFEQKFDKGRQIEFPEAWLQYGNPWEFERPEVAYPIEFYGRVEEVRDGDDERRYALRDTQQVLAVAYDTPVVGWGGRHVNTLRLWSAKPVREFDLANFNQGNYLGAVEQKVMSETLSRVLYPNDSTRMGQELRFKQEFFFTSASLQDIIRRFRQHHDSFESFPDQVVLQLNDTHPAIAVAELIRLLVDKNGLSWEDAWEITRNSIAYTNHTLMPEALERWPVPMVERLLPRHMQIIYEINARFLRGIAGRPGIDNTKLARLSLIDEAGERSVRMAHLAFVGSFKVNGVSALHTDLLKKTVFHDLHEIYPDRITNKTNGITPRRWLYQANPPLRQLITDTIGDRWITDLERLQDLEPHIGDAGFRARLAEAKRQNKSKLARHIKALVHIDVPTDALFDVQIKRIHEYKRQLLNLLHTVALYNAIRDDPTGSWQPRVKIFAGKAAPSYSVAKMIIKLINDVARVINQDPAVRDLLKVAFLPNYNVSLAERIIPAADLSEQISTAGFEASGTGNMKLALNGALTIGTLDGANVEIRERVGEENIFIFGLTAAEVAERRADGFDPRAEIDDDPRLKRALNMIASGVFSPDDRGRFQPLIDELHSQDRFFLTADFNAYCDTQQQIDLAFADREDWLIRSAINIARIGWFSSDRTVREYATEIWHAMPPTPLAQAAE